MTIYKHRTSRPLCLGIIN